MPRPNTERVDQERDKKQQRLETFTTQTSGERNTPIIIMMNTTIMIIMMIINILQMKH